MNFAFLRFSFCRLRIRCHAVKQPRAVSIAKHIYSQGTYINVVELQGTERRESEGQAPNCQLRIAAATRASLRRAAVDL
jgi:hypothetical protein